jgi:hypothetical protein
MVFDHSKFNLHVRLHQRDLEAEQPTVRLSLKNIADGFDVPLTVLTKAMKGETVPNRDNLDKMATGMKHNPNEYFD